MKRLALATVALCAAIVALASVAGADDAGPIVEPVYLEGKETAIIVPSASSHNQTQRFIGCFPTGPDMRRSAQEATAPLYVLFLPGATQFACPDGVAGLHDHVLGSSPGEPGYTGAWRVIRITPGLNFDVTKMPYTSRAAVAAGIAAGELVAFDTGIEFRAPVRALP